jgi:flagellar hook-basal body complex protein FliE
MKALLLLSALLPAGIIASFFAPGVPTQDDDNNIQTTRRVRIVETNRDPAVALAPNTALTYSIAQGDDDEVRDVTVVQTPASPEPFAASLAPLAPFQTQAAVVINGPSSEKEIEAVGKLSKAKSDEERAEARAELKEVLNEQFEQYLKQQAKELDRLQAKLKKLQSQLDKRRDAKEEIVALRMKQLENEVNGLGWQGSNDHSDPLGHRYFGVGGVNLGSRWYAPRAGVPSVSTTTGLFIAPEPPEHPESSAADEDESDDGDSSSEAKPKRSRNR